MCIILPREGKDLSNVLESLDSAKWGQLTGRLTKLEEGT